METHPVNALRRLVEPIRRRLLEPKMSFSQCGEDLIVEFALQSLRIPRPTYLDIGAHHPISSSNTYLFYSKGCRGVCVEPNPILAAAIRKRRPHDVCLQVGIGVESIDRVPFYVMEPSFLSTFRKEDAQALDGRCGHRLAEVIDIPQLSIQRLITEHCAVPPHFVSLDIEGMDLEILRGIDFARFRPQVFCVETLTYTPDKTERKLTAVVDLMRENGYLVYGDTFINTIFVCETAWRNR